MALDLKREARSRMDLLSPQSKLRSMVRLAFTMWLPRLKPQEEVSMLFLPIGEAISQLHQLLIIQIPTTLSPSFLAAQLNGTLIFQTMNAVASLLSTWSQCQEWTLMVIFGWILTAGVIVTLARSMETFAPSLTSWRPTSGLGLPLLTNVIPHLTRDSILAVTIMDSATRTSATSSLWTATVLAINTLSIQTNHSTPRSILRRQTADLQLLQLQWLRMEKSSQWPLTAPTWTTWALTLPTEWASLYLTGEEVTQPGCGAIGALARATGPSSPSVT